MAYDELLAQCVTAYVLFEEGHASERETARGEVEPCVEVHLEQQVRVCEGLRIDRAVGRGGRDDSRARWRTQTRHEMLERLGVSYRTLGYRRTFKKHVEPLIGRREYRDGGNRGVATWPRSVLQKLLKDAELGPKIVSAARAVRARGRGVLDLILEPGVPALPRTEEQRRASRRRHYDARYSRIENAQGDDETGRLLCLREAFDKIARRIERLGRLPTQRAEQVGIDPAQLAKDGWRPDELAFWDHLVRRGEARRRVLDDGSVDYVLIRRVFLPYFSSDPRALRVTRLLLGRSWSPPGAPAVVG